MCNGVLSPYGHNRIPIPFPDDANETKATITQSLTKQLFERSGYRVYETGIEKQFPFVKYLTRKEYIALDIPLSVRMYPDLTVIHRETGAFRLIEVKYRRTLDEQSVAGLNEELTLQHKYWPDTHAVLMIAVPFHRNGTYHKDYVRVMPPDRLSLFGGGYKPQQVWNNLLPLPDVFPGLKRLPSRELDRIAKVVHNLPLST